MEDTPMKRLRLCSINQSLNKFDFENPNMSYIPDFDDELKPKTHISEMKISPMARIIPEPDLNAAQVPLYKQATILRLERKEGDIFAVQPKSDEKK